MYTCLSLWTLVVSWQAVPCAVLVCGREDDSLFVGFLLSVTCLEVNVKVSVPRRFSTLPMSLAYYVWPRCPSQHTSKVTNTVHSSVSNWWTRVIFGQQLNSQVHGRIQGGGGGGWSRRTPPYQRSIIKIINTNKIVNVLKNGHTINVP